MRPGHRRDSATHPSGRMNADSGTPAFSSNAGKRITRCAEVGSVGSISAKLLTVGASNKLRTERPAARLVFMVAIKRIAERESPPRSKNESSIQCAFLNC
jgi:hypothetical protein